MGSLTSEAQVVEDCFGVLKLYSDGSIYRMSESEIDFTKYKTDDDGDDTLGDDDKQDSRVEWEDCMFDETHKLYLRVYRPCSTSYYNDINNGHQLPILYFLHGGGFCVGSRTWPNSHNYCLRLSSQLEAIVIAPDYRLAPEHRLPAAIEDGKSAVKWLQLQAKSRGEGDLNSAKNDDSYGNENLRICRLLEDGVDFSKVFIIGDSSGGNIAHHLAVYYGFGSPELAPVRVCGYVLLGPFFGGSLRTKSEADGPPEPTLNLDSLDRFWRLSLPIGESRDHPSANPFGPNSPCLKSIAFDPILVVAGGNEIMKDRIKDYADELKMLGKDVTYVEFEAQHHGFYLHNPCSDVSARLSTLIKSFIFSNVPLQEF